MVFLKRFALLFFFVLSGCGYNPHSVPVDTSWYSTPPKGKTGIYFFQYTAWKDPLRAGIGPVEFVLDGKVLGVIGMGEWLYFEVPAGVHKLRVQSRLPEMEGDFNLLEGHNYFMRGSVGNLQTWVLPVDEETTMKVIENIKSGHYERGDID